MAIAQNGVRDAFQTLGGRQGAPKPEDLKLSDMISSYWVNFAKNGDPNGPGLPKWPAFAENDLKVMVFDAAPSARPLPNLDNVKVFDAYISWLKGQASGSHILRVGMLSLTGTNSALSSITTSESEASARRR